MTLVDRSILDTVRVEFDARLYPNKIENHSAQTASVAGWKGEGTASIEAAQSAGVTSQYRSPGGRVPDRSFRLGTGATNDFVTGSEVMVVPGQVVSFSADFASNSSLSTGQVMSVQLGLRWIGTSTTTSTAYYNISSGLDLAANTVVRRVTVPAGVTRCQPILRVVRRTGTTQNLGSVTSYMARAHLVIAPTLALATTYGTWREEDWQTLLGDAVDVQINRGGEQDGVRDDIATGTCTVTVTNADLDPSKNILLRRGRAFRVTANPSTGPEPIFTGKVAEATVEYRGGPKGKPRINLTAVDAGEPARRAISPYLFDEPNTRDAIAQQHTAHVIPWRYDNAGASLVPPAAVIRTDDGATLWDRTRLLARGLRSLKQWVDRYGYIAYENADITTPSYTLDDTGNSAGSVSFTDVRASFGVKAAPNQLTVRDVLTGQTSGPYQATEFVREWGVVPAELEVVGKGASLITARGYLQRLARPIPLPESVTFHALEVNAYVRRLAWADLYQGVRVILRAAVMDQLTSIVGIEHRISAKRNRPGGTWTTTLRLRPSDVTDTTIEVVNLYGTKPDGTTDDNGSPSTMSPNRGPLLSRYVGTSQAISTGTTQSVNFDAAAAMDGGVTWSTSERTATVPRAGRYLVAIALRWSSGPGANRQVALSINGGVSGQLRETAPSTGQVVQTLTRAVRLAANDAVRVLAFQDSGQDLDLVGTTSQQNFLDITYLGD